MRHDFCAFILSHGRPDNVKTLKTLQKCGYTGKWFIVIDNEDEFADRYVEKYGDRVIQFDKAAVAKDMDEAEREGDRRTVVYARNACFDIARDIGIQYFIELDDDYSSFEFRKIDRGKLRGFSINDIDTIFDAMIRFMDDSNALTVAFAQGGDFIGGPASKNFKRGILRKAMNSFICDVEKPFKFVGRINEDVNTYVTLGSRGNIMFTLCDISLTQTQTQKSDGGMSGVYEDGTFLKSMYTVMMHPSSVTVKEMGTKHRRLHHSIDWNATVPKIIRESWKKC